MLSLIHFVLWSVLLSTPDSFTPAECNDVTACNYNSSGTTATDCVYATGCDSCSGEQDGTGTVLDGDADDDGVCDTDEVAGCQNASACNYNNAATDDDSSCVYASGCDTCSGETDGTGVVIDGDCDDDGNCDDVSPVAGCMIEGACNYDPCATVNVNSTCQFVGTACNDGNDLTIFDQYNSSCTCAGVQPVVGCMDATACNYNSSANFPGPCEFEDVASCLFCSQTIGSGLHGNGLGELLDKDINDNGTCDDDEVIGCNDPTACNYWPAATTLPDPANALYGDNCVFADSTNCEFCAGTDNDGLPYLIMENGVPLGRDSSYTKWDGDVDNDGICLWLEVEGCTDEDACNYNPDATELTDDSVCQYPGECGCDPVTNLPVDMPAGACNCNGDTEDALNECGGTCAADTNGNGICDVDEVEGCMDSTACNYNASANMDDGSCIGAGPCGCLNGAPVQVPTGYCDCNGETTDAIGECLLDTDDNYCHADTNANGLCDALEIQGCTDVTACNYDATAGATLDDNSCQYIDECGDCKLMSATDWGIDPGKCNCQGHVLDSIGACLPTSATNFCTTDENNNDLCDDNEIHGCTDPTACNFNPLATYSEDVCLEEDYCGTCGGSVTELPAGECNCEGDVEDALGECGGDCEFDVDGDGVCDDVDLCVSAIDGVPCDPTTNPDCPRLDECNACLAANDPDFGVNPTCGCIDDIPEGACDECLEDSTALGGYVLKFPEALKDCDGNCLYGLDDGTGQCLHASNAVPTSLPNVTDSRVENNTLILEQSPLKLQEWTVKVDSLHARMARNLDDGTLTGASDTLTIEQFILNRGNMVVEGETRLQDTLVTASGASLGGDVVIDGNLLVNETARILGTTFSDGGLETSELDMTGDLTVGGRVRFDSTLQVLQKVTVQDTIHLEEAITLGNHNVVLIDSSGFVRADSVVITDDLSVAHDISALGNIHVDNSLRVNQTALVVTSNGNTSLTGTLTASGLVTMGNNLDVAGNIAVKENTTSVFSVDGTSGNTSIQGTLSSGALTASSITSNGAVGISGNTTVKSNFYVKNADETQTYFKVNPASNLTTVSTALSVQGMTTEGTLEVKGDLDVVDAAGNNTFEVTRSSGDTQMGDLTAGAATLSGDFSHTPASSSSVFSSTASQFHLGPNAASASSSQANHMLVVDGKGSHKNGILIRTNNTVSDNGVNFVTFMNNAGTVVGRIEGETVAQLPNDAAHAHELTKLDNEVRDAAFAVTHATLAGAHHAISMVTEILCTGTDWVPKSFWQIPDWPDGATGTTKWLCVTAQTADKIYNIVTSGLILSDKITTKNFYKNHKESEIGVTYQSGSGDYAELIEKQDFRDVMSPGQVIGVRNGKVSFTTTGADHLFVVSTDPIVLGNDQVIDRGNFVPAAFMGQVPVLVVGTVHAGDFIIASGDGDGLAIARTADELQIDDLSQLVGVAWEDGDDEQFVQKIKCSVGVDNGAVPAILKRMQEELQSFMLESRGAPVYRSNASEVTAFKSKKGTNSRDLKDHSSAVPPSTHAFDALVKPSAPIDFEASQVEVFNAIMDAFEVDMSEEAKDDMMQEGLEHALGLLHELESANAQSNPENLEALTQSLMVHTAEMPQEFKSAMKRVTKQIIDLTFSNEQFEFACQRMRVKNPEFFKKSSGIGNNSLVELGKEARQKMLKEIDAVFR